MTVPGRLRLDEVISSVPELGPSLSDSGYSWITLIGSMAIQMTVPSVVSMYGIILGQTANSTRNFDMWQDEIALTPILFVAFWNLADPWTRAIINLASVPRAIGFIGICLLSIGVLASGYLSTGGVGAYLASSSAGAVMGIGGSFILNQTDIVLQRNFRTRLRLTFTLKEIATSIGFLLAPIFMYLLLTHSSLHISLLLMACIFIPALLGSQVLRYPLVKSRSSPYTLLISEEDNELTSQVNLDDTSESPRGDNGSGHFFSRARASADGPEHIFGEGSEAYSYQGHEEDQELFNTNPQRAVSRSGWASTIRVMKYPKFWLAVIVWTGCKASFVLIWILLLPSFISTVPFVNLTQGLFLSITVALGTFFPNIASFWKPNTARTRSLCFGAVLWLECFVLLGLAAFSSYHLFFIVAFCAGISISGTSIFLELAINDLLNNSTAGKAHTALSTISGLSVLCLAFVHNPKICLEAAAFLQFIGGCYWTLSSIFEMIRAR